MNQRLFLPNVGVRHYTKRELEALRDQALGMFNSK